MSFFSTTLTATTSRQLIMSNKPNIRKAVQIEVIVRDMGTATYIRIGGWDSQDRTLRTVGDSISITSVGRYFDLSGLFAISDTSDAVLEIIGETYCAMGCL